MPLRPQMEASDYLDILRRRKWHIVFSILLTLFVGGVYCVITPVKYKSSTTILVIAQRVPEGYVRSTFSAGVEDRLSTMRQQILSRTRLLAVMDELGLFKQERKKYPAEEVVEKFRKNIEIQVASALSKNGRRRDTGEDAFSLTVAYKEPRLAMLTASRLASYFIDENLKTREQQAVGTSDFLESQLKKTKVHLQAQEERIKQYKLKYMGELPQQLPANLQILSRLQDRLKMNSDGIRTAQDRKVYLQAQIGVLESQLSAIDAQMVTAEKAARDAATGASDAPAPSPTSAAALASELSVKKSQLAALSEKYTGRYPEVRRLKGEIAQMEKRLAEAIAQEASAGNYAAPPLQHFSGSSQGQGPGSKERNEILRLRAQSKAIDSEIASLQIERKGIEKTISGLEARVEQSPRREQEMVSLTRDYENLKSSYDDLLKKKLDADVSQNLEKRMKGEHFQILDPANLPQEPFSPDRPKVFGIAFIAALLIGFGGAIGFEMINPTLRGKRDFQHFFKVPVLASIPVIRDAEYETRKNRGITILYTGVISIWVLVILFVFVYGLEIRNLLRGVFK